MNKKRVIVFGAGGHAKVVVDVLEQMGAYQIVGLVDDSLELKGTVRGDYSVLGNKDDLAGMSGADIDGVIVALGDNYRRKLVCKEVERMGFTLISAIHPSAVIGSRVRIGAGTLVVAGVVVNVDAEIGVNVIVNTGATVDHDCRIGAHVHLSPGVHLAGRVSVGALTHVGIGAVVLPNLTIGANCVVGAGSVVRENVPDGVVVVGNPARVIRQNEVALGL
ncbi:MAG: acetyltransferase [Nitrospira sp.]|nr:acetyltransferase [Nitrospira sp.]